MPVSAVTMIVMAMTVPSAPCDIGHDAAAHQPDDGEADDSRGDQQRDDHGGTLRTIVVTVPQQARLCKGMHERPL
jgi:hypothetical protein